MGSKQVIGAVVGLICKIVVAAVVLMLIYNLSTKAYDFCYRIFGEGAVSEEPGETITVTVTENESLGDIGKLLEDKGLIRDAKLFAVQARIAAGKKGIKAGSYELNTSMTIEKMIEAMMATSEGETISATDADNLQVGNEGSEKNTQEDIYEEDASANTGEKTGDTQ